MTTTNISPSSIVVEVLRDDNYDDWSACMKSYMLAQDLWDFIEHGHHEGDQEVDSKPIDHQEGDSKALRKKNAAALHAIQISCAPHILSEIRSITSAKVAWDTLANLQQQHSPSHKEQSVEAEPAEDDESQGSGSVSYEINGPLLALYKYAHKGDWDATKNYLRQYPNAKKAKIKPYGGTALHVAAFAGKLTVVEELVKLMSEEELEIKDDEGSTALLNAATVGITKMAECLVRKNKHLVTSVTAQKKIPLVEACIGNHKDMALYLYSVTAFEFLRQGNGHHGSYFLQCAIGAQMLDIAFDFLHRFPYLATTMDEVLKTNGLIHLSKLPHLFPSASRLAFWQKWIYSCIPMQSIGTTDDNVRINMPDQSLSESKNTILHVLSKLRGFAINLLAFFGIKQIYDLKKIHIYSDKILRCMCEYISTLDYEECDKADIEGALHNAVENGMVEFIIEVVKACPHLMVSVDDKYSRHLFMSSIANRQEKVFSLFYGLEADRAVFLSNVDSSENTMLHLAAKLSPPSQLARISGAALQMQRELQWYKEVESILNPSDKDDRNTNEQTARELFTSEHKDLLVKGEQWMKEAATSCTVVGALIITIMFTAAFTVPGGNVQETGYPVFKDERRLVKKPRHFSSLYPKSKLRFREMDQVLPIALISLLLGTAIALIFFKNYFLKRKSEIGSISEPGLHPDLHKKPPKPTHQSRKPHSKPHSHASSDKDHNKKHHPLDLNTLKGHGDSVSGLCFSYDGRSLATACADGVVRVFKLDDASSKSFKFLRINVPAGGHPVAVAFSDDASSVVVASQTLSGSSLYMWGEEKVKATDDSKQQPKLPLPDIKWEHHKIHEKRAVLTLVGTASTYGSGDGSTIVASCSEGTDIKIWHGKTGKVLGNVDTNQLKNNMATISPNGRFIAAAAFTADVKVWEIVYSKDGSVKEVPKAMQLKGHKSAVTWLCFTPDSEQIITASKDGSIRIWNINVRYHLDEDPKTLKVFPIPLHDSNGATLHYDRLSLSPDGRILAATHGSMLQWLCVETGKVLDTADNAHNGDITWIAWAPKPMPAGDGQTFVLATASVDKKVKLWAAPPRKI